jgi:WD40 repeat protein
MEKLSELPGTIRLSLPTFNADATRVAFARDDASLEVRDVEGREPALPLAGHGFEPGWVQLITGFEFFPDGRRMVSAGVDKTARIWDLKTGRELAVLRGHSDVVQGLAVSTDNRWVATSSRDRTVRIWDASTGALAGTLRSRDSVPIGLLFTPDGSSLISILSNGDTRFWSVRTAIERTLPAAELDKGILWAEQLQDGLHWWSATPDQKWELHRIGVPAPIVRISDTNLANLRSCTFHPGTQRLAYVSTDGTVTVQSLANGTVRRWNSGASNPIATARFSTDGRLLAVGLGSSLQRLGSATNQVQVWDVEDGRVVQNFFGAAEIHAFSPDNRWLASSDSHGKVQLNDLSRGVTRVLGSHRTQVPGLAFSPDSTELASACTDGTIKLWNVRSGVEVATLETQTSGVLCVAYSPGGDRLISGSLDGALQVWDARARLRLATFHRHGKGITSLAFRDADTLVSGGLDAIRIWQAEPQPQPAGDGTTMESAMPAQPGGRRS